MTQGTWCALEGDVCCRTKVNKGPRYTYIWSVLSVIQLDKKYYSPERLDVPMSALQWGDENNIIHSPSLAEVRMSAHIENMSISTKKGCCQRKVEKWWVMMNGGWAVSYQVGHLIWMSNLYPPLGSKIIFYRDPRPLILVCDQRNVRCDIQNSQRTHPYLP